MIFINFAKITFNCPNCKQPYIDDEDKYLDRCNKNKKGYTTIKCNRCDDKFGFTYDIKGDAVSFII